MSSNKFLDLTGLTIFFNKLKNVFATADQGVKAEAAYTHATSSHAPANAEVNQNAFSNVKVGSTTVAADSKTDTLEIVAGSNITITPDATNDKITIAATNTTYGAAGSSLGLVKSGGDVTISSGTITVNDDSHNHTISNVDGLQTALDGKLSTSGTAAKATADSSGQNIADTYIKSLSVNGRTITYTKGDGDTGIITTQDTNTTYSNMKGATTSAAGSSGLVPAPSSGAANRYLRSDGTWSVPPDTNTTYSDMKGATSSANGAHGLVPQPDAGEQAKFLRGDGTWQTPANTTYADMKGATADAAGSHGLVPAPAAGAQGKFLRGDGTWQTPANTTYGAAGTNLGLVKSGGDVTISNGTITVNDDSHNHTISNVDGLQSALDGKLSTSGNAASATKLANARTFSITGGATASGISFNGTGNVALNVTALDASKLTTGTVPIDRLPAGALERLVTVENQAARFSLTTSNVQLGDTVQQLDTGIMYIVVNTGELDNANGYKEYTAATATKVPWSGVTDKPTSFTPSSHTHTIANVTGLQSALDGKLSTTGNAASASKLSTARTISLSGDVTGSTTFDGSGNVTIAATVKDDSHNHTIANVDGLQTALNGKLATTGTAAKATADANGQNIADTYIKALSVSGRTITYTKGDGGTGTITTQDTNTTYSNMTGASSSAAGKAGLVPAPSAGSQAKFLRGDGTWQTPTNTTYANMTGATSSAAGKAGLVPAPAAGKQTSFLRGDGTWAVPTNTDTKATQTNTTTNADYRVVLSTNANDTTETNTLRKSVNFQANPSTGAFYAKGYDIIDLTGKTQDLDDLTLSSGSPMKMLYIEKTNGGAANITNSPVEDTPFLLEVELLRWASATDYVTLQTFRSTDFLTNGDYVRACVSGTWREWTRRPNTYSLSSFGITATAAELNKLDGVTATATELNYVDGVTSNIQTQLNGKASTSHTHNYAGSSSAGGAANSAVKLSTARTIRTNLGSTSTASFDGSANITPGVTGTLAVGNGGTGATTAAAARTKLGFSGIVVSSTEPTTQNTNEFWLQSY